MPPVLGNQRLGFVTGRAPVRQALSIMAVMAGDIMLVDRCTFQPFARSSFGGDVVACRVAVTEHQIRLERQRIFLGLGRWSRPIPWAFLTRLRRVHSKAGDADDPVLLTQAIEYFAGLR